MMTLLLEGKNFMPEINSNDVPDIAEKSCTPITNSNNEELDTNDKRFSSLISIIPLIE